MKPYSEKLRDPRWLAFRAEFIASRRRFDCADECDDCGVDTAGRLNVHHRFYKPGADPWEYKFEELRLLCSSCHQRIHYVESFARELVLSIAAHECYEFEDLLRELQEAQGLDILKQALAHAKNAVRNLIHEERLG